jgi:hypothetical protein
MKPPLVQLIKNFPKFYGTRRFFTVVTRFLHWSLSWAKSIHSIPHHPTSLRSPENHTDVFSLHRHVSSSRVQALVYLQFHKNISRVFLGFAVINHELLTYNSGTNVSLLWHNIWVHRFVPCWTLRLLLHTYSYVAAHVCGYVTTWVKVKLSL